MKKQVIISAPGKLLLLGEHAVVHGKLCLVTAVSQRFKLKAKSLPSDEFMLEAPEVGVVNYRKPLSQVGKGEIPQGAKFVEMALANFLKRYPQKLGVAITTEPEFKSTFGFGSSSAATVCTLKALSELSGKSLTNKQLFDLAFKTVLDVQGVGSGFDVAAAIFGGTLLYSLGGKTIKSVPIKNLSLVVGYTGIKADTTTLVKQVNIKAKKHPQVFNAIFDQIESLVIQAHKALLKRDDQTLGELMDINQGYLEAIGAGSVKLSQLIYAARNAGAYGAKLSGAGGGDCMIAITPNSKVAAVKRSITKAGGIVVETKINAEGVKIEA